jgi:diketogulonate reductase-like aldo/keto reductase
MRGYAEVFPAVNQTELSPFNQAKDDAEWCAKEGVMLQAFAPVVRGQKKDEPVLLEIAKQVNKSWSHVLLRYGWQKG